MPATGSASIGDAAAAVTGARRQPGHARRRCVALAEGEHDRRSGSAPDSGRHLAPGTGAPADPDDPPFAAIPQIFGVAALATHPHAAFDPATAVAPGQSVVDGKNQRDHRLRPSAPPAGAECTRPVPILTSQLVRIAGPHAGLALRCQQRALGPVLVLAELRASHRRSAPGRTEQESGIGARFEGGRGTTRRGGCITAGPRRPSHRARWFRRARPPKHGSAAVSLGDVLVSIFWFMLLFAWIWLLITIFADIFRDHELSGWGKALWALFIIVIPWLGALVYLIARGRSMNERALAQAQRKIRRFRQYVHETASSPPSTADELAKLADLRDRGRSRRSSHRPRRACWMLSRRSRPPRAQPTGPPPPERVGVQHGDRIAAPRPPRRGVRGFLRTVDREIPDGLCVHLALNDVGASQAGVRLGLIGTPCAIPSTATATPHTTRVFAPGRCGVRSYP